MCVYARVCMMYVCMFVRVYVTMHECMYPGMNWCVHVCTSRKIDLLQAPRTECSSFPTCMYDCMYICVCMYVCMYVCMWIVIFCDWTLPIEIQILAFSREGGGKKSRYPFPGAAASSALRQPVEDLHGRGATPVIICMCLRLWRSFHWAVRRADRLVECGLLLQRLLGSLLLRGRQGTEGSKAEHLHVEQRECSDSVQTNFITKLVHMWWSAWE